MKIVKFKNGKYAIRKWNWFYFKYIYKDLQHNFWWTRQSGFFNDCLMDEHKELEKYMKDINDYGTLI